MDASFQAGSNDTIGGHVRYRRPDISPPSHGGPSVNFEFYDVILSFFYMCATLFEVILADGSSLLLFYSFFSLRQVGLMIQ